MQIDYNASLAAGAGQFYGQMIVSNLRYDNGTGVTANNFLAMTFSAPAAVTSTDITPLFVNYVETTADVQSVAIDTNLYSVSLTLTFAAPHTFEAADQITIGVNGDLTTNTDTYLNSFIIAADAQPDVNGTVNVHCANVPDPALASIPPTVVFIRGSQATPVPLTYGQVVPVTLAQGDYQIVGADVRTSDLTVVAPIVVSPSTLSLATGETATVEVSFGDVQRSAAVDFVINALSGLDTALLAVTVSDDSGNALASFSSTTGATTELRRLPASGTAHVGIGEVRLNNVDYRFSVPDITLANSLQTVTVTDAQVSRTSISTAGFVTLPIRVTADATLPEQVTLRLTGGSIDYSQTIAVETQSISLSVPVMPGTYTVSASAFLFGGSVYAVDVPNQITVASGGGATLDMSITQSANLNVRGFPSYLSFGGLADLTANDQADFVTARASSLFRYAGTDGAGDSTVYLTDDQSTRQGIALARNVEAALTQPVLPVMVSYTINLSLCDTPTILANADAHAHSFANYILALNIANSTIDATHPVPAGFIVNPDFLGACQQGGFSATYAVPVRAPLQTALDRYAITAAIPSYVTEDVKGYVAAVNWLTRTVAPQVTFGWQVNLWGVGNSEWIYQDADDPVMMAQQIASYIDSLEAYTGAVRPDFLAIDRYEADDFTQRAYVNGYCYAPREWGRYYDFCEGVSRALKLPVMPWQISAARIPNTYDQVNDNFDSQDWGTGGSYLLGDPAIGSDYNNINPTVLALQFPEAFQPYLGDTVEDLFIRSTPFDISQPSYGDFPLRGIFAVLLGGGATTGIVSSIGNPQPYARDRLAAYASNPIPFDNTVSTRKK